MSLPPAVSSYEQEILGWREWRRARLTAPEGWLSVIALEWLAEGENTVGSDPSNRVVLPHAGVPPRLGSIEVRDGRATARFHPAHGATHDARPVEAIKSGGE